MAFFSGTTLKSVSPLALCFFLSLAASPIKAQPTAPVNQMASDRSTDRDASARLARRYGKLPISFEPNQGQSDKAVQFLARGSGYMLFLEPDEAFLSLFAEAPSLKQTGAAAAQKFLPPRTVSTVGLKLIGANTAARAQGEDRLPGYSNYLIGSDPGKWHTDVPTYAKVRYSNIYPGIDLLYYGNQEGVLEHDFVVNPGADASVISLALQSADTIESSRSGGIILHTKSGDLELQKPVAYQVVDGRRETIPVAYARAERGRVSFQLGAYDRRAPLVIDPVLRYTYAIGGSDYQPSGSAAIAVDSSQNTYIVGGTQSASFPLDHPYQASCDCPGPSGYKGVGFISKINAAGTAFVYSTYFGYGVDQFDPNGKDTPYGAFLDGIAVDSAQRTYFIGYDPSVAFNPADEQYFIASLNAAGDALLYREQLHGNATAIALDASHNAYVTGRTDATFTPIHSIAPTGFIYVQKVSSTGVVEYASEFGNSSGTPANGHPYPFSIAVDSTGAAYITGDASTANMPTTAGAYQRTCANRCAFVAKISPDGSRLVYSTFLAGTATSSKPALNFNSEGFAIQVDSAGEAYVAGRALPGFPVTANAFQRTGTSGSNSSGVANYNGYVTRLNAAGSGILDSTLLYGGAYSDNQVVAMALDPHRTVYVTGTTSGTSFPQKAPISAKCGGFLTTLSPTLSSLAYYSILVGGRAVAVDKALNAYLTGAICPATKGSLNVGLHDVSVTKIVIMDDIAVHISASPSPVAHGANLVYTISATSNGPDFGTNVHIDDAIPAGTTFVSDNAGGGKCTAPAVGGTGTLHCSLGQLNKGQTYTVKLTVKVKAAAGTTLSNRATGGSNMQDYTPSNNAATVTTKVN